MCKRFQKINISYPLLGTHSCENQGVRNISFFEENCACTKWMIPNMNI